MSPLQLARSLLLAMPVWMALGAGANSQAPDANVQRHILAIYSDTSTLPASVGIADGLRDVLEAALPSRLELHTEFRAIQTFPGEAEAARFVDMLIRKYADEPLDAVLAIGPEALRLVSNNRERFASGAPVVAAAVTERSYETPHRRT